MCLIRISFQDFCNFFPGNHLNVVFFDDRFHDVLINRNNGTKLIFSLRFPEIIRFKTAFIDHLQEVIQSDCFHACFFVHKGKEDIDKFLPAGFSFARVDFFGDICFSSVIYTVG